MLTLGSYELLNRLGVGGMGEVWTARRMALGGAAKLVAIKTLRPDKARDPMARRMFLDEARLSMLLSNSNIVQVFDVDQSSDGTCYMAMELVDGIDLSKLKTRLNTTREILSYSIIAYIVGEILKALAYAHEFVAEGKQRTIVHRDISPQNVMISMSGEVKLTDFGVARLASEETSGLFVKGKLRYMPPEQLRGQSREPTVDLFAVGAILHELLEGQKFRADAKDERQLLGMCVSGEVPKLTRAGIPEAFERLHRELLAANVEDRIPSARAAHRLLSRWTGDRDAKFELEEVVRQLVSSASMRQDDSSEAITARPAARRPALHQVDESADDTRREAPTEIVAKADLDASTKVEPAAPAATTSKPLRPRRSYGFLGVAALTVSAMAVWMTTRSTADASHETAPQLVVPGSEVLETPPRAPDVLETEQGVEQTPERTGMPSTGNILTETPTLANFEFDAPSASTVEPNVHDALAMGLPALEAEPEKAEPVKAEPVPAKSKPKSLTTVAFVVPGNWGEVMIGDDSYIVLTDSKIEPAQIKPGKHKVWFRADPESGYRPAGIVIIPQAKRVTLVIGSDRTASIEE